jgi:hypothetical protein
VRIQADGAVEVELELPTALAGGGRVLDAETEDGILGARIQPFSSGGSERSFPWGPPVEAGPDGTFELSAFVPGSNHIRVDADGFASTFARANVETEGFLDWGDIRLHRPQRLRVTLLGLDEAEGLGATDLRAEAVDGHILPEKRFGADGTVEYDAVPPGAHRLFVSYPDNSWARLQLQLDPGRDWDVDFQVGGARELSVIVLDAKGEKLPFDTQVMVVAQEENGVLVVRLAVTYADGTQRFEGIRADKVQVWIWSMDQETIGSREVDLVASAGQQVEIRLDGKPFRVRILDEDERPVAGAAISIRSEAGDEILGAQLTDTDGEASFFGLPARPVLMDVGHGLAGRRFGVPIDASRDEIEFVLEADGVLELEVRDGEVPLAGVAVQMETESGVALSERKQTDDHGNTRFEPLGEGRYHVSCRRADCWPVTVARELSASEHALVAVQMRRLADLELHVTNAAGLPVTGLMVELTPAEIDGDVASWIEERRVRASTGLTTDAGGVLRVQGLPRGDYRWSIGLADQPLEGAFELLPGRANVVRILLPE